MSDHANAHEYDPEIMDLDPVSGRKVRRLVVFHLKAIDRLETILGRRVVYYGPWNAFSFESAATGGVFHFDEVDGLWSGCWTPMEGEGAIAIETRLPTDLRALRALGPKRFAREVARHVVAIEGSLAPTFA